ncbi:SDR family NAD(P)-dependent oxidoreductase [Aliicoccus persicus]|uniref:3-oxoacyl-[acyl-carrier protein] reductase n=1 Tax=Aliicoccus persicus TaxID=930138 RepID=A0A662Z2V4_9STAP|nr:SDR family oxidoreductase [Aliicoccus persicus]SEV82011.1 3-oxoacyl-[acyl-carrier protein] reductase [Aliicoccus persicus]
MSNILIVGSTGVIGKEITRSLSDHTLYTVSRNTRPDSLENHFFLDLSRELSDDEIEDFAANIESLDAIVWSPGVQLVTLFDEMSVEALDIQYYLSVRNLTVITQALLPKLKNSMHGRIIVISSIWGEAGASCEVGYASMKGAQNVWVKSLAKELATTNITVNAIAPGAVDSDMLDQFDDEDKEAVRQEIPQLRFVTPEEVAHAVNYLLSSHAQSVTGEIMRINGGWYT